MINKYLLTVTFIVGAMMTSFAQTTVPSLITSDQTWNAAGSPYEIGQNTYIDTGVTVKIMPGAKVVGLSSGFSLIADGELQSLGTATNRVTIENIEIVFSANSEDWDDSTQTGAYFKYTDFSGKSGSSRCLNAMNIDLRIDHCYFENTYYSIYKRGSKSDVLHVTNSEFKGRKSSGNYYSGYPIYTSGYSGLINVKNCEFHEANTLYLYGGVTFEENHVHHMGSVNLYSYYDIIANCNSFENMTTGVRVSMYATTGTSAKIEFNGNSMDSIAGPMLIVQGSENSLPRYSSIEFNENNFLNLSNGTVKVQLSGTNNSPATADTLDFTDNYWGTTSATAISGFIKDYADDIKIFTLADFSGYTSTQTGCSANSNPCAKADFDFSVYLDQVSFHNESDTKGKYHLVWDFGDGNTDSTDAETPTHTYSKTGKHTACLYVYDSLWNLCDYICKEVEVKVKSTCQASYYLALDTNNKFNIFIVNNSTGVSSSAQYYWTFGDGYYSNKKNPTHQYASFGLYQLCLTIVDSTANCYSAYCDSIGLDSLGNLLKADGFTISVLNEEDILSVDEQDLSSMLDIYPNPAKNVLNIRTYAGLTGTLDIELINTVGRSILSETIDSRSATVKPIDISNLPNAVYYVKLGSGNDVLTKRILIAR